MHVIHRLSPGGQKYDCPPLFATRS